MNGSAFWANKGSIRKPKHIQKCLSFRIQDSVAQCEWVPSSDSSISVIGWQKENETEFNERKLIGNYF